MYSRHTNDTEKIELPPNYGGSIFGRREVPPRFVPPQNTPPRPTREYAPPAVIRDSEYKPRVDTPDVEGPSAEAAYEAARASNKKKSQDERKKTENEKDGKGAVFPSLSSIGTEELLLIAIALMVFQGGKEPDLALILLALLFIE